MIIGMGNSKLIHLNIAYLNNNNTVHLLNENMIYDF